MIEIKNVMKTYDHKRAIDDITFDLPDTGLVVIAGKNGSGKSTLLNLIGGIVKPDGGNIVVDGVDIASLKEEEVNAYRESTISFILQDNALFENMTSRDNITVVGGKYRVDDLAPSLGLAELLDHKVKELSGGEKRRVAIARAVVKESRIILADEPTASLDDDSTKKVYELLKKLSHSKLVIVVSHDEKFNRTYGDVIVTLDGGKIQNVERITETFNPNETGKTKVEFKPFKFGLKLLFANKKRLLRICLLLMLTFFFTIFTMSIAKIDYIAMEAETANAEKNSDIQIEKWDDYDSAYPVKASFSEEDIRYLQENRYTKNRLQVAYSLTSGTRPLFFQFDFQSADKNADSESQTPIYYKFTPALYYLNFMDIDDVPSMDFGRLPESNNEIVITSYMADLMIKHGVMSIDGLYFRPTSYEELVQSKKEISLNGNTVLISGITKIESPILDRQKETTVFDKTDNDYFTGYVSRHGINVYVGDDFYDSLTAIYKENYAIGFEDYSIEKVALSHPVQTADEGFIESLADGEIIINAELLEILGVEQSAIIGETLDLNITETETAETSLFGNFVIKGVSKDGKIYFSKNALEPYRDLHKEIFKVMLFDVSKDDMIKLMTSYGKMTTKYTVTTPYRALIEIIHDEMRTYCIFGGVFSIIFAILSVIFLRNHILNSVDIHRKDIATLKILGVKTVMINKLFIVESLVTALVSYAISFLIFIATRIVLNDILSNMTGIKISVIPLNILVILLIIIFSAAIAILITRSIFKKIKAISPQEMMKNVTI